MKPYGAGNKKSPFHLKCGWSSYYETTLVCLCCDAPFYKKTRYGKKHLKTLKTRARRYNKEMVNSYND